MLRNLICESMVAFDAEWKPTFFSTNEVALIQMVESPTHRKKKYLKYLFYAGYEKPSLFDRCHSTGYS